MTDPAIADAMKRRDEFLKNLREGKVPQSPLGPSQDAVRLRGTNSAPSAGQIAGREGHIMATQMMANPQGAATPGAHFSFYPEPSQAARQQLNAASQAAIGAPLEQPRIGFGQPPFQNANPMLVSGRPGHLAEESSDKYLHGADGTEKPQDFDHTFDPRFMDPARFAAAVRRTKSRQGELATPTPGPNLHADSQARQAQGAPPPVADEAARRQLERENEFRLGSVPMDQTGDRTKMGRDPSFNPADPRVVPFAPPTGAPQATVQGQNCGTELMKLFASMGMLKREDFLMLGGDAKGNFQPGRDLTPQQLMDHMRWREAEFQVAQKAGAKP